MSTGLAPKLEDREERSVVGKPMPGPDERAKVRGETEYADDYSMEEMLHGVVMRSDRPSATIESIDTYPAEEMPGVATVLTAADVPNNRSVSNVVGQSAEVGLLEAAHQVLAEDVVRYYGEPIALVAAETREIATEAAAAIKVEYGEKPGVFDPEEAMAPDAPKVHGDNNVIARWKLRQGDVKTGFEAADVSVENTYNTPFQEHAHTEPESGVGWIDDDGVLNLRVATQVIEQYREVAGILDIPESKVRIRGTIMGGGFGGKEDLTVEPYIALLVWDTRRPVKVTYDRDEMFYGRHKRSPFTLRFRHGATADGELVAFEGEVISDSGAYVYLTPWILLYAVYHSTGPYDIPNVKLDGKAVLTNNTYGSAFRSFGAMEVTTGVEQQIEQLARKLDMDPQEFRAQNYLDQGETTASGQTIESEVRLEESQAKAVAALGEPSATDCDDVVVGQGFASSWQSYGRMRYLHDMSSVWVNVEKDGSAVVRSGIPDLGGGQRESLRKIAGEELGIPLEEIQVNSTDTQTTPLSGTVTATRALYMSGNAVQGAARKLADRLRETASDLLRAQPRNIELDDKEATDERSGDSVSYQEIVQTCHEEGDPLQAFETFHAPTAEPITGEVLSGDIFPDFTFSTQAAEVAVDTRTGEVKATKLALAHDVGTAIDPGRVEGQIEGGAIQGLGYTLMENYQLDNGVPITRNLADYPLPSSVDVPEMESIIIESGSGKGPYGAKGIGEPAITATPAAICNAIYDAIDEVVTDLPADPETVYSMLHEQE